MKREDYISAICSMMRSLSIRSLKRIYNLTQYLYKRDHEADV